MRLLKIVVSASFVALASFAGARELATDRVTFQTDAPQSAYGPGDAEIRTRTLTLPLPFEGTVPFRLIVGAERTPNPEWLAQTAYREAQMKSYEAARALYESVRRNRDRINRFLSVTYPGLIAAYRARLAAWRACRVQPLVKCGGRPQRPRRPAVPPLPPAPGNRPPPVTAPSHIDTRAGVSGEVYVRGMAAIELRVGASLGHIDPEFVYETRIEGPDQITPGAYIQLESSSRLVSGRIDGATPGFFVNVDQIMRIDAARIQLTECTLGEGCAERLAYEFDQLGLEKRTSIVAITPAEATFFGEVLPERFIRAGAPVLRLEAVVSVELGGDTPQTPFALTVNGIGIPPNTLAPAVAVDIATIIGQVPYVEVAGERRGDGLAGEERSDYLGFRLDVDAIAKLPGGVSFGNAFASIYAELWDVEAGPQLDVYQSFEMDPELSVMLEFDPPVRVEGGGTARRLDATGAMPRIAVSGPTQVTPIYQLRAEVASQMGFQAAGGIEVDLIKGGVTVGPTSLELGPLAPIRAEWAPEEGRLPLLDRRFPLGGLREIRGATFTIGG